MDELRTALAVEVGDKRPADEEYGGGDIIDCCLSLITHELTTGVVGFIHPSVRRWFDNEPQHLKLLSHSYIAKTCLAYLTFDMSCCYPTNMETIIRSHPFYLYAAAFWHEHLLKNAQDDWAVQSAFVALSESENSWTLMQRIRERHGLKSYLGGLTRLQVAAACGMYDFCNRLFRRECW